MRLPTSLRPSRPHGPETRATLFLLLAVPRLGVALLTALLGLLACAKPGGPTWIDLARGFEPRPMREVARGWIDRPSDRVLPAEDSADAWIERSLAPEDWRRAEGSLWVAARPLDGAFAYPPDSPTRLIVGGVERDPHHGTGAPELGEYALAAGEIRVALPEGERPGEARFAVRVRSGRARDGVWRMRGDGVVAAAVPVWSGEQESRSVRIPPGSVLAFVACFSPGAAAETGEAVFRIRLGDRLLSEFAVGTDLLPKRVPLPRGVREGVLSFEVEGAPGLGLFLTPELAPAEVGHYGERPYPTSRPDMILFLADTFRADLLASNGAAAGLTPHLDRFASESARFTQARSASSWTLPSIATLLTGLYPGQHAAVDENVALPDAIETLPERLAAVGYRTGAITDGGFFTQGFGLDQGFSWFQESTYPDWNLRRTLQDARAFLDRDDGRPIFLVVHTYRVHAPYRSGPEEDLSTWNELMKRGYRELEERGNTRRTREAVLLSLAEPMRALYDEGVRDLDACFGLFRSDLERRGLFDSAWTIFTADHGEAFGEHGDMEHGKDLWDVKVRVPLLVHGPGLGARRFDHTVSLVDLVPSLASLAGLDTTGLVGTSLLNGEEDHTAYSFLLERTRKQLALTRGSQKVYTQPDPKALRSGEVLHAFRLDRDPAEEHDLATAEWAAELLRGQADTAQQLLTPRAERHGLGPAAEERQDLRQIGYGGD